MKDSTIGQFLSSLRKSKGYTQQNVADALNVSNKTVSGWERDVAMPDANFIPLLAELYGVSCDELLKGRRESPVPYDLRSDEVSSRLFVSTYSAQKTMNAIVWTIVACLFLAGGYLTSIIMTACGGRDSGLYYSLSLPFTTVSIAITLTGYFTTDYTLRLNGKEFTQLRLRLLNITRGALLAEVASPFILLPILFSSGNAVNTSLFCLGFAFLTIVPLFLVDSIIKYCNKDLYPRTKMLRKTFISSAVIVAATLCCLTVVLPIIYEANYSAIEKLQTQTEFDTYEDMEKALGYDPLQSYASSKTYTKTENNKAECLYVFPKNANISELLRVYPEYTLYRFADRDELRITYNILTLNKKEYADGNEVTVSTSVVLTSPSHLYASYAEERDGKYVLVAPVDAMIAQERVFASSDLAASVITCAAGVFSAIAFFVTILICRKKDSV